MALIRVTADNVKEFISALGVEKYEDMLCPQECEDI